MVGRGVNLIGYLESPHMSSQYLFIQSKAANAIIKELNVKMLKSTIFMTPSLTPMRVFDLLSRLATYGFLLPPKTFCGSKCNT